MCYFECRILYVKKDSREEGVSCQDEVRGAEERRRSVWSVRSTGLPLSLSVWEPKLPTQREQRLGSRLCLMYVSQLTLAWTCVKEQTEASWVYSLDSFTLSAAAFTNKQKTVFFAADNVGLPFIQTAFVTSA